MQGSPDQPKFFVDAMLGNVAKKLRLLGFDTKYSSDVDDKILHDKAIKEKRIIITKDRELAKKTRDIKSILIIKNSELEQILEILKRFKKDRYQISGDVARCPKCNSLTSSIGKNDIANISKKILEQNERFWKCENCHQVYWEGTHMKKLQRFVSDLNDRL